MTTPNPVVQRDPLSMPVGALCAVVEAAHPEDSLRAVARELGVHGLPVMPVARNYVMVGAVSESVLTEALMAGVAPEMPVSSVMDPRPLTLLNHATGAEALRTFADTGSDWAIVVDANGEPLGVVTPSRLFDPAGSREYLGRVGGMATPFGVYLTNGVVSGGSAGWSLVATGALMSVLFHVAGFVVTIVQNLLPLTVQRSVAFLTAAEFAWMALFFFGLRLLPLAGTHGAEHMVVHAIERGEELKPEIVRRMPRVHPRCGTNLAVAAMLFLGIMSADAIRDQELRLLLAALTALMLWQPLGALLQLFVTTKPPTAAQLDNGIAAGRQLLQRIGTARVSRSSVVSRLAMSGLFQVLAGGAAVALLVSIVCEVLRVPPQWRVS